MNVSQYLDNGHGADIIQGSVSLDDETEGGCTEIVPGFHKCIRKWWEAVGSRRKVPDGPIHGLEKLWLPEDSKLFGDFVPILCARGDVRLTRPEIPYGSTHNKGGAIRRTILPWFVGVHEDGETLDNIESDKWSDVAGAYARQTAVRLTPSGYANRFGPIPYKFPPSTQLNLPSPISQAILTRTTWDDPMAQIQANIVLGKNRVVARQAIDKHRIEALREFKVTWKRVKVAEQMFYGKGSCFVEAGKGHT